MGRNRRAVVSILLWSFLALSVPSVTMSGELSPSTKSEIAHLLDCVEKSGCQFNRNGTWYKDTKAIREHAELKLHYFMDRGRVNSTEDFIKWAGSKSEISGKAYLVRCGDGSPMPTAQWLKEEVERYRKGRSVVQTAPITATNQ